MLLQFTAAEVRRVPVSKADLSEKIIFTKEFSVVAGTSRCTLSHTL